MTRLTVLAVLFVVGACATVDETEWCAETRYGRVVEEAVSTGLHGALISEYTCFDMTERLYPSPDEEEVETMEAQTRDQLTLVGDVSVTTILNEASMSQTFRDKRRPAAVDAEIVAGIRSGYRNAVAGWTVSEIFSDRRAFLADSVRVHIQRSLGDLATVLRVYVRDMAVPEQIERARIQASARENELIAAQRQAQIDSVQAWGEVQKLAAEAEGQRLMATALEQSPGLLQLRAAEALAGGLSKACQGVQTCILGGDVMQRFLAAGGN